VSVDTLQGRPGALPGAFDALLVLATAYAEESAEAAGLATIPGTDAPVVYLDHRLPQLVGTIGVVLEREPTACPRTTAIQLEVEGGRLRAARHLRAPWPARGCDAPTGGWWSTLAPPVPGEGHRGWMRLGDVDVELGGASPALEELLRWGLGRFSAVGLEPPAISRVQFSWATGRCAGVGGRTHLDEAGVELLLCFDERQVCGDASCASATLSARITLLHELAHAWAFTHMDEPAIRSYLDRSRAPAWYAADLPWEERGVERAAETLMWGLLDQRIPLPRIGDPPCEDLSADFRHLTGAGALRDCEEPGPPAAAGMGSTRPDMGISHRRPRRGTGPR
jgi:hypothetical protein